jgi:pimeloyl-ACP methyl ester carboxylesterase
MAEAAGAQMEVIAGVGHTLPLEAPDTLARLITAFWARTGPVTP